MKNNILKKQTTIPYSFCNEICTIIQEKFGIVIQPENQDLIATILEKTMGTAVNVDIFLKKLSESDESSEIFKKIVTLVTIGETQFFRDTKQVELLKKIIIPTIIENKIHANKKNLRIWSAGCSSGEELYTIIIMFNEILKNIDEWNYQFLGTDINGEQLHKAINGNYKEWSMRSMPKEMRNKYFTLNEKSYAINEKIKKMATFEYLNLSKDLYPSLLNGTSDQDLILCRNVLIYFDVNHIDKIMNKFSHCLNSQGFLLLGASDPCMTDKNGLLHHSMHPSLLLKSNQEQQRVKKDVVDIKKEPLTANKSKIEKIKFHDKTMFDMMFNEIEKLESLANWEEIINLLNNYSITNELNERVHIFKANAYANLGKTKEAIKECELCLSINPLNEIAYFVSALILSEESQYSEAQKFYKKSLFLNPNFIMCLYQYGLYLIRHGDFQQGIQMLTRALEQAKCHDLDGIVPESGHMKYRDVINLVENEIAIYRNKSMEEKI